MNIDHDKIISYIYEKINFKIDKETHKLLGSDRVRSEMKEKYGDSAFLDSKDLKFPVVNPKTGESDCKLIYAAIIRSKIYSSKGSKQNPASYYANINESAKKLYSKEKCEGQLKTKINEGEADLLILNYIFSISESEEEYLLLNTEFVE